ncbi:hypothetical protein GPL17_30375 [Bradyrhizobium yuanmingense]|uniref:hypothetical protein n=1 Tax=Bradyrhizobium yuanmingense TaxID=108015 RepID=UPI0012FC728F|nr:hypothetical protein [Bradyrhizobium yuanmingense]MVT54761.1 hypothetical protein [Bradyrhizobium yuanmingense]
MRNYLGVERDIAHHCDRSPAAATVLCRTDGLYRQQQASRSAHELLIPDPLALWTIGRKATAAEASTPAQKCRTRVLGLAGAQHLIRKIVVVLRGEQVRLGASAGSVGRTGFVLRANLAIQISAASCTRGWPHANQSIERQEATALFGDRAVVCSSGAMPMTLSQELENRSRAHSQTEESSSTRAFPAQSNVDSGNC